jgi:hypothetical protein
LLQIIEVALTVAFRMSQELDLAESAIRGKVECKFSLETTEEATT